MPGTIVASYAALWQQPYGAVKVVVMVAPVLVALPFTDVTVAVFVAVCPESRLLSTFARKITVTDCPGASDEMVNVLSPLSVTVTPDGALWVVNDARLPILPGPVRVIVSVTTTFVNVVVPVLVTPMVNRINFPFGSSPLSRNVLVSLGLGGATVVVVEVVVEVVVVIVVEVVVLFFFLLLALGGGRGEGGGNVFLTRAGRAGRELRHTGQESSGGHANS